MYKHLNKHGKHTNTLSKDTQGFNNLKRNLAQKNVIMQSSRNPSKGSRTAVKKRHAVLLLPTLKDDCCSLKRLARVTFYKGPSRKPGVIFPCVELTAE